MNYLGIHYLLTAFIICYSIHLLFVALISHVQQELFRLDIDTCPTTEAKNLTELNYSLYVTVVDRSGPKIDGSESNVLKSGCGGTA